MIMDPHTRVLGMIGYGTYIERKFIEDWVASLQLRPRIGQKF